ncbi:hypothetical protein H6G64_34195 [Calothrix sp. FACHB-156]|nr:hypothetical protein [Calothrix sp. FACHB-156]
MKCQHCGFEFRLNVKSDRWTKSKYLRAECCDSPLRPCPDPDKLLRSPNLTPEERQYLAQVAALDWFSAQVAAVLLQMEAKAQAASVEVAA